VNYLPTVALFSTVLTACGIDVAGTVGQIGAQVHQQCGWVADTRDPLPALPESDQCYAVSGSGCALLPVGADACTETPTKRIRASQGSVTEVYSLGTNASGCVTQLKDCL
jgi:hypothetical protein